MNNLSSLIQETRHVIKHSNIRSGIIMLLILLISMNAYSQKTKETRQERKEREKKEREARYAIAEQLIKDSTFVVHGDRITLKNGITGFVTGNINFVKVAKENAVLQIAPNSSPNLGANGLGGVTIKGRITKYEIKDKKKSIFLQIYMQGRSASVQLSIRLHGDNNATVDVSGMFTGPAFTMYGKLEILNERLIFEGSDL